MLQANTDDSHADCDRRHKKSENRPLDHAETYSRRINQAKTFNIIVKLARLLQSIFTYFQFERPDYLACKSGGLKSGISFDCSIKHKNEAAEDLNKLSRLFETNSIFSVQRRVGVRFQFMCIAMFYKKIINKNEVIYEVFT